MTGRTAGNRVPLRHQAAWPADGLASREGPDPRPPHVLLIGNFGTGNFGNDASASAVRDMLLRHLPDASLAAACPNPEFVEHALGMRGLGIAAARPQLPSAPLLMRRVVRLVYRLADVRHVARSTRGVDAVLVPGTGVLDDFGGDRATSMPLTLWLWLAAARRQGAAIGFVGIGAGPLSSRVSRALARRVALMADYQTYRDEVSRRFMTSLGLPGQRLSVVPDVVFATELDRAAPTEAGPVAIAVMDYSGWRPSPASTAIATTYQRSLADFASWLLRRGYQVHLVSADTHDVQAVRGVAALVQADSSVHAEALTTVVTSDFRDLVSLLARCHCVVATRYHSVVAGLMAGVPVISLGYAEKNVEMMGRAGLADFVQWADRIEDARLREQFVELERRRPALCAQVGRAVEAMSLILDEESRRIAELIRGRSADATLPGRAAT